MALLPIYDKEKETVLDGEYIKVCQFCKNKINKTKCKKFYADLLSNLKEGFFSCPFGMTVYKQICQNSIFIFSCLKVKNHFEKKNTQRFSETPQLTEENVKSLVQMESKYIARLALYEETKHDVIKFNSQIKNIGSSLLDTYSEELKDEVISQISTIVITSMLCSVCYENLDMSLNPDSPLGQRFSTTVYKKFDKMRLILRGYNPGVRIQIDGESYYKYRVYYNFDLFVFILLENAVKYSPRGNDVNIVFREDRSNELEVFISSIGPSCSNEEIKNIYNRGFRGNNAKASGCKGNGLGLFLAKKIADLHNISIDITSNQQGPTINSIQYGEFKILLRFGDCKIISCSK